jgi:hypothetical protein
MTFSYEWSCLRLLISRKVLWLIELLLQLMRQRSCPPNTQEILHIPIAAARMDHSCRLFSAKIHVILLLRTLHPFTSMLCWSHTIPRGSRGKGFFAFLDLHIRQGMAGCRGSPSPVQQIARADLVHSLPELLFAFNCISRCNDLNGDSKHCKM